MQSRIFTNLTDISELIQSIRESYEKSGYFCRIVFTSGYFLYLHDGHIDYLHEATKYGNIWITAVNGDEATKKKYKNGNLISAYSRAIVLSSIKYVHYVIVIDDDNMAETIRAIKPDVVFNSGDRRNFQSVDKKEIKICREVRAKMVFGKGAKINSSTEILKGMTNDRY